MVQSLRIFIQVIKYMNRVLPVDCTVNVVRVYLFQIIICIFLNHSGEGIINLYIDFIRRKMNVSSVVMLEGTVYVRKICKSL